MAAGRKAGRNAALYVSLDGTAAPTPVTFANTWSVNKAVDPIEVTAFGDSNKSYVSGLPDATGQVAGFMDLGTTATGTDALYNAANDGLARNFYLYIDATTPTVDYFYGSAIWDFSAESGVGDAVKFTSSWRAAGPVTLKQV